MCRNSRGSARTEAAREDNSMGEKHRVTKPHQAADADPLNVRKGKHLSFERRETEWPEWIWCTSSSGKSTWVPENWVEIEGDSCVMKRDYVATELAVDVGEVLTPQFEESGWAWATTVTGEGIICIG